MLATWKVLIALGVTPVLYTIYAIVATVIAIRAKAPLRWIIAAPLIVGIAFPVANLAALKFGEAGMDVLKCVAFDLCSFEVADIDFQIFAPFACGSSSRSTKVP